MTCIKKKVHFPVFLRGEKKYMYMFSEMPLKIFKNRAAAFTRYFFLDYVRSSITQGKIPQVLVMVCWWFVELSVLFVEL